MAVVINNLKETLARGLSTRLPTSAGKMFAAWSKRAIKAISATSTRANSDTPLRSATNYPSQKTTMHMWKTPIMKTSYPNA